MTDEGKPTEEVEYVGFGEDTPAPDAEEAAEIDVVELLNFLRGMVIQLAVRVSNIEEFLGEFFKELEKQQEPTENDRPKLEIIKND